MSPIVYLGTHEVSWLARLHTPLFISRRRLARQKSVPRALGPWALDSGGFSELSMFGEWRTTPEQYVAEVRRYRDEIGNLQWAAIQDWMCEPFICAKTGKSVEEHQRLTIDSFERLCDMAPEIPWVPVLQGWAAKDYHRHVDMYEKRGWDLRELRTVGIGSVCRRQGTSEAEGVIRVLAGAGIRLHGFGFKTAGLAHCWDVLKSADSTSWSFGARKRKIRLEGCTHANCGSCIKYAVQWLGEMLANVAKVRTGGDVQLCLWETAA